MLSIGCHRVLLVEVFFFFCLSSQPVILVSGMFLYSSPMVVWAERMTFLIVYEFIV